MSKLKEAAIMLLIGAMFMLALLSGIRAGHGVYQYYTQAGE